MFSPRLPKHLPSRLAVALALGLPATAIAAPEADDAAGPAGPEPEAVAPAALITGLGAGLVADPTLGAVHPVDGEVDYGTAINTFGGGGLRSHEGQDVFAPEGTPLLSPVATEVLEAGSDGGRGNWVALYDRTRDRTFVYFHMREPASVRAGKRLMAGAQVGRLGCTGSCDGAHLHIEIRRGRDTYGPAVDPLPELQRWESGGSEG